MKPERIDLASELIELVRGTRACVPPKRFFARYTIPSDETMAELIETDGRVRASLGRLVRLSDYEEAIPDLHDRPGPLDAAISAVLRCHRLVAMNRADPVAALVRENPAIKEAILDAAALDSACVSPPEPKRAASELPRWPLPRDFGPELHDQRLRYHLVERLGSGSFGVVYLANDRVLGDAQTSAPVAVKVLATRGLGHRAKHQLLDEGIKARRIDHENVVRVLDRGVSIDGFDYIVFDHIAGGDLQQWIRGQGGTLPPKLAVHMALKIAKGVQAAHAAGLAHCDLKPANILITAHGEPKIADFGIAARLDDDEDPSRLGQAYLQQFGSLAFLAPETFRGSNRALSTLADIYAIGGILYWMLTGTLPNGSSPGEIASILASDDTKAPSPRRDAQGIDPDLDLICRRVLEPDPDQRYPTASHLADDLESWLNRRPLRWARSGTLGQWMSVLHRRPFAAAVWCSLVVVLVASAWALLAASRTHHGLVSDQGQSQNAPRASLTALTSHELAQRIALANASGHSNDLQTLLWRTDQAWALLREGEPETSLEVLDAIEPQWRRIVMADDRWLLRLDALRLCARADITLQTTPVREAALTLILTTIEQAQAALLEPPDSPEVSAALAHRASRLRQVLQAHTDEPGS